MKFDVDIPSLNGPARLEIRTVQERDGWAAYVTFVSDRMVDEACLMLGRSGIPHRFTGATEEDARDQAKKYLQQNYHVARILW